MDVDEALVAVVGTAPTAPKPSDNRNIQPQRQPQQQQAKRQGPPNQRKPRKRYRGNGAKQPESTPSTSYDKAKPRTGLLTYPRREHYIVFVGNAGLHRLCRIAYSCIESRDFRMAAGVSADQLEYCMVIAYINRIIQCATHYGYSEEAIPESARVRQAIEGLAVPNVLAKYIESIGSVSLANGTKAAPWSALRPQLLDARLGQINPDDILHRADRPIPDNYWSVDREWIALWNQATTRPSRIGMQFRTIAWSEFSGQVEMLATPREHEGYFRPTVPQVVADAEAQLGACYEFRTFATLRRWPEQTSLVCAAQTYGTEFYPDDFWNNVVVQSFISSDKESK